MKRVPEFVQIAAAEITVGYNRVGAWPIPVTGSVLYALDKQGPLLVAGPQGLRQAVLGLCHWMLCRWGVGLFPHAVVGRRMSIPDRELDEPESPFCLTHGQPQPCPYCLAEELSELESNP